MKCFYCGRPYKMEKTLEGIRLACKFPRCKAQPCSDFHETEYECEMDMELIRESWKEAMKNR